MPARRWKVTGAATFAAATPAGGALTGCGDDGVNEIDQVPAEAAPVDRTTTSTGIPMSRLVDPSPESADSPAESPVDSPESPMDSPDDVGAAG